MGAATARGARGVRLRLDVAYLGTRFEGWQVQAAREGEVPRTVQGELETALAGVYGVPVGVHGAGRTDSGVHADGQVAHLDVPAGAPAIPPRGLVRALNRALAEDVRVTGASAAPDGWHARFSASGKLYRYRLRRGEFLSPHAGLIEALAGEPLDVEAMRRAAACLVGVRDFGTFSLTGSDPSSTVRHLRRLDVFEEGPVLVFEVEGDGFLRGMVRRLVGTLREVGRGRTPWSRAVETPGPTAEARGLTLRRVFYPGDAEDGG